MLSVRRATREDAVSLAARLRKDDLNEILAAGIHDPEGALLSGFDSDDPTLVAVDEDDVPHIIFGTSPSPDPLVGFVWMMASDAIRENWVQVLRETRPWVDRLHGQYRILANAVHADNRVHIRWLRWAGFVFLREFNFNGARFYEFAKITPYGG